MLGRVLGRIAFGTVVALMLVAVVLRVIGSDPAVWHVDPLRAEPTGKPNAYRVGPEGQGAAPFDAAAPKFAADAGALARAFDAVAMAAPRTTRLAGGPQDLWATYVQRSQVFGFPDYVSVRFLDLPEGGATLALFSRARFGRSDLGVNRARVEKWLAALADSPA